MFIIPTSIAVTETGEGKRRNLQSGLLSSSAILAHCTQCIALFTILHKTHNTQVNPTSSAILAHCTITNTTHCQHTWLIVPVFLVLSTHTDTVTQTHNDTQTHTQPHSTQCSTRSPVQCSAKPTWVIFPSQSTIICPSSKPFAAIILCTNTTHSVVKSSEPYSTPVKQSHLQILHSTRVRVSWNNTSKINPPTHTADLWWCTLLHLFPA